MVKLAKISTGLSKEKIILGMVVGLALVLSGYKPTKIIDTISGMLSDTAALLTLFYIAVAFCMD